MAPFGMLCGAVAAALTPFGRLLGPLGTPLWRRCGCLDIFWEAFGTSWGAFGATLEAK